MLWKLRMCWYHEKILLSGSQSMETRVKISWDVQINLEYKYDPINKQGSGMTESDRMNELFDVDSCNWICLYIKLRDDLKIQYDMKPLIFKLDLSWTSVTFTVNFTINKTWKHYRSKIIHYLTWMQSQKTSPFLDHALVWFLMSAVVSLFLVSSIILYNCAVLLNNFYSFI